MFVSVVVIINLCGCK